MVTQKNVHTFEGKKVCIDFFPSPLTLLMILNKFLKPDQITDITRAHLFLSNLTIVLAVISFNTISTNCA